MAGYRRALEYVLPSLVAACAGAVVVGWIEGALYTDGLLPALASAGFASLLAVPIGLVGGLAARLVWRAWRPRELAERLTEETGGAPLLAAWISVAALAIWSLYAAAYSANILLARAANQRHVAIMGAALVVALVAGLLLTLSLPLARGIAWGFRRLDRRLHRALGRSLLTPPAVMVGGAVLLAGLLGVAWFVSIAPRVGHLSLAPLAYVALFGAIVLAVTLGWPLLARRRAVVLAVSVLSCSGAVTAVGAAVVVRHSEPYTMLQIWGDVPLGGGAIDNLWDIQSLRGELDLSEFRPVARAGARHPDVVLVTIDTLRADRTPLYGGPAKMPALQGLSRHAAYFRWAFSPGNVTRRSLPSMVLGLDPRRVRGRVAGWALRLDPRHVTLAERLRSGGYDTAGFFCCGSQFASRHRLGLIRGIDHIVIEYDGGKLVQEAVAWLRARRQSGATAPLFLWVHLIEPHRWDEQFPRKTHGGNVKHRYDLSLENVDDVLATMIDGAWSAERRDDTVLVVTSDHGEGLGDHGNKFHSTDLYNSQIRVPLVIGGPGIEARRFDQPVGLVSLTPTILDLAGFEPPGMPHVDGVSAAPLLRGDVPDDATAGVVFSAMMADRSVSESQRAVIAGKFKLIERDGGEVRELYELPRDPRERRDLADKKPEVLERLEALLEERARTDRISPF